MIIYIVSQFSATTPVSTAASEGVLGESPPHELISWYCAAGPVRAGDLLVPSGRGDGTAVVLATPTDADARLECEKIVCGPVQEEVHQSTIGVALVSNMASGPILVECSVTPPAMTKEVISSLRGKPQTEQATKLLCRIFCSISITLMLIFVVNSVAFAPGALPLHSNHIIAQDDCIPLYIVPASAGAVRRTLLRGACFGRSC